MIYIRNTARDIVFKNIASFKLTDNEVAILDGNGLTVFYKGKLAMHLDIEREVEINVVPKAMRISMFEPTDNGKRELFISNTANIRLTVRLIDAKTSTMYVVCKDKQDLLYEGIIEKVNMIYDIPNLYSYGTFMITDYNTGEVVTRYYLKGNGKGNNDVIA